ncbi:hypothetical protein [Arthrobacter sp. H14]|uniref:hypothetical protein n=1 Tax=Arthrobacter sp. H14 TaxID=1312959 RepID=UPI0004ADDFE3|nr:hypothetical protein [Arthrobacter sp. H14]
MTDASTGDEQAHGSRPSSATLHVLRITAMASVLALVFQFVTAGQILAIGPSATALHGGVAIAIHIIFGLTVLAAAIHWRSQHGAVWPVMVVAVSFVLSFFQAHFGSTGAMSLHVPIAVVLTIGIVWVTAWSFTPGARH